MDLANNSFLKLEWKWLDILIRVLFPRDLKVILVILTFKKQLNLNLLIIKSLFKPIKIIFIINETVIQAICNKKRLKALWGNKIIKTITYKTNLELIHLLSHQQITSKVEKNHLIKRRFDHFYQGWVIKNLLSQCLKIVEILIILLMLAPKEIHNHLLSREFNKVETDLINKKEDFSLHSDKLNKNIIIWTQVHSNSLYQCHVSWKSDIDLIKYL